MKWFKKNQFSNPEAIQDTGTDDFKEVYSNIKNSLGKEKLSKPRIKRKQSEKFIDTEQIISTIRESHRRPSFSFPFGSLIGGFVVILVGISLAPNIAEQISMNSNITTGVTTITNLTTIFFVFAIVAAGLVITAQGLRATGILR